MQKNTECEMTVWDFVIAGTFMLAATLVSLWFFNNFMHVGC